MTPGIAASSVPDTLSALNASPETGLTRIENDSGTTSDYIVIEMAKHILGKNWMAEYVDKANNGGIERVLL